MENNNVEALIALTKLLEMQKENHNGSKQINIFISEYLADQNRLVIRLAEGVERVVEGWDIVVVTNDVVTPIALS